MEKNKETVNLNEGKSDCQSKMTTIGGQALMEGLMMIGPEKLAMAVRKPDGNIHIESAPIGKSSRAAKIPFVRGSVKIFRQMVTGTKYLMKSAQYSELDDGNKISTGVSSGVVAVSDEEKLLSDEEKIIDTKNPSSETDASAETKSNITAKEKKPGMFERVLSENTEFFLYLSAILGIFLSVGMFILLPNLITGIIDRFFTLPGNRIVFSLIEGIIRISIFILYLALASNLKDIKRVWMYHGAEHKTIACYENKKPLNVENVKSFSKHHPRCGTAFMFIILITSIILFSFIPKTDYILLNMLIRLSLVPFLAGISYEIIRLAAKHDNMVTRTLSWPGLMLQRLTTKEPDDKMLEVAIAAMIPVIPEDQLSDLW